MTWSVVCALIFGVATIIAAVIALTAKSKPKTEYDDSRFNTKRIAKITAVIAAALTIAVIIFGSLTMVSTRSVGVVTTFGKPGASLGNGLHIKAPWQSVTEMDAAIQIDTFTGDHSVNVRLGNNSTARADVSVRWQIKEDAATQLFLDYREFENLRDNLVTRSLQASLNDVFANFDPLSPENADGSDLKAQADLVLQTLQQKIGKQIDVIEVIVPIIDYDDQTEEKINQLNAEKAATRVAQQRQQTADAEAIANQKLAASVANDPNVIVAGCIRDALAKGISPMGCWPSTNAVPTYPVK